LSGSVEQTSAMIHNRTITKLMLTSTVVVVATAAGLAAAIAILSGGAIWWHGWVAAVIVSGIAAALSLGAVVGGIVLGGQWTAYGHLAGSALRVLVAAMACVAAIMAFRAPPVQTLALMLPLYFAQLVVEAVVVGRAYRAGQVG
jgi:hypothetical protein